MISSPFLQTTLEIFKLMFSWSFYDIYASSRTSSENLPPPPSAAASANPVWLSMTQNQHPAGSPGISRALSPDREALTSTLHLFYFPSVVVTYKFTHLYSGQYKISYILLLSLGPQTGKFAEYFMFGRLKGGTCMRRVM